MRIEARPDATVPWGRFGARAAVALLAGLCACGGDDEPLGAVDVGDAGASDLPTPPDANAPPPFGTLLQVARAQGLDSFVATATTAGLGARLEGPAFTTVFAPTDDAFRRFAAAAPASPELLENILLGHVVDGDRLLSSLENEPVFTLARTLLSLEGGAAAGARLEDRTDLPADNGTLHVTRDVLPSWPVGDVALARPDLGGFGALVASASTLAQDPLFGAGPLTVFAPTDAALAAADVGDPDAILGAHVTLGQQLSTALVDGARLPLSNGGAATVRVQGEVMELVTDSSVVRVIEADIRLSNGVVHVIDGLLVAEPETRDLITTLRAEGLTTMAEVLERSGLALQLAGPGPFTVFAPTNAAFAAAQGTLPASPALIVNVLLNHVAAGRLASGGLNRSGSVDNLGRRTLQVVTDRGGGLLIGGAPLSSRVDIQASNGVIHVLDAVVPVPTVLAALTVDPELSGLGALLGGLGRDELAPLFASRLGRTLFAPTNASLARVETSTSPEGRLAFFEQHILPQPLLLGEMTGQRLRNLAGRALSVRVDGGGRASVITAAGSVPLVRDRTDVRFRDGTLHFIDGTIPSP